jgi:aldehyde dehydrogenase (NAD+)
MQIAQEEIFGPVLAIIPYDSVDEAVEIANDTVYGLGAHVQGQDLAAARAVAARIRCGPVHINYPAWLHAFRTRPRIRIGRFRGVP